MKITETQLRKLIREQAAAKPYWAESPRDRSPVRYEEDTGYFQSALKEYERNDQDHGVIEAFGGKDEYLQRLASACEWDAYAGGYGGVPRGAHSRVVLTMVRERV